MSEVFGFPKGAKISNGGGGSSSGSKQMLDKQIHANEREIYVKRISIYKAKSERKKRIKTFSSFEIVMYVLCAPLRVLFQLFVGQHFQWLVKFIFPTFGQTSLKF